MPGSRAALALLWVLSLGVAGYAVVVYALFSRDALVHPEMGAVFRAEPVGLYLHVFASALTLGLGPFQFSTRLRAARPALHRWLGRIYLGMGVLVGGLSGLYMALHSFAGPVAQAGFACLALAWLYTGFEAYRAIRRRDIVAHRRWMVRNFALAFAAVTLRLYLPAAVFSGADFAAVYSVIAWLCWVPNLWVAERVFNRTV